MAQDRPMYENFVTHQWQALPGGIINASEETLRQLIPQYPHIQAQFTDYVERLGLTHGFLYFYAELQRQGNI